MGDLWKFFTEMDARAARAFWISAGLFALAGIVLGAGIFFIDIGDSSVAAILRQVREAWWAPVAVIALFTILAFVGAPQIALIAGTVAVFDPAFGIMYSWLATMISASVGYAIGRFGGRGVVDRFGGQTLDRAKRFIGKNGFAAAALIRLVPSGPFIFVNLALGAARVRSLEFLGGTGAGIIPKILLVAFAGHGLGEVLRKENLSALLFFAGAAAVWLILVAFVRPRLRGRGGDGAS